MKVNGSGNSELISVEVGPFILMDNTKIAVTKILGGMETGIMLFHKALLSLRDGNKLFYMGLKGVVTVLKM